jgi:hypothetical protein
MFKMTTAGEKNRVMKLLVVKCMAGVEQAVAKRAAVRGGKR